MCHPRYDNAPYLTPCPELKIFQAPGTGELGCFSDQNWWMIWRNKYRTVGSIANRLPKPFCALLLYFIVYVNSCTAAAIQIRAFDSSGTPVVFIRNQPNWQWTGQSKIWRLGGDGDWFDLSGIRRWVAGWPGGWGTRWLPPGIIASTDPDEHLLYWLAQQKWLKFLSRHVWFTLSGVMTQAEPTVELTAVPTLGKVRHWQKKHAAHASRRFRKVKLWWLSNRLRCQICTSNHLTTVQHFYFL